MVLTLSCQSAILQKDPSSSTSSPPSSLSSSSKADKGKEKTCGIFMNLKTFKELKEFKELRNLSYLGI